GDRRDADLAGGERPTLGHVHGGLLVARVVHLHALGEAAVEERHDMPARETEHMFDPGLFQRSRENPASVMLPGIHLVRAPSGTRRTCGTACRRSAPRSTSTRR